MAIRKSPYKVNDEGVDEAFVLPVGEKQPPAIKVRKARREDGEEDYEDSSGGYDPFGGVDPFDLSKQIVSFRTLRDGDELPDDRDATPEPNKEFGRREVTFKLPARRAKKAAKKAKESAKAAKGGKDAGKDAVKDTGASGKASRKAASAASAARDSGKTSRSRKEAREQKEARDHKDAREQKERKSGAKREDKAASSRAEKAAARKKEQAAARAARAEAKKQAIERLVAMEPATKSPRALAGLVFPRPAQAGRDAQRAAEQAQLARKNFFPSPGSRRAQAAEPAERETAGGVDDAHAAAMQAAPAPLPDQPNLPDQQVQAMSAPSALIGEETGSDAVTEAGTVAETAADTDTQARTRKTEAAQAAEAAAAADTAPEEAAKRPRERARERALKASLKTSLEAALDAGAAEEEPAEVHPTAWLEALADEAPQAEGRADSQAEDWGRHAASAPGQGDAASDDAENGRAEDGKRRHARDAAEEGALDGILQEARAEAALAVAQAAELTDELAAGQVPAQGMPAPAGSASSAASTDDATEAADTPEAAPARAAKTGRTAKAARSTRTAGAGKTASAPAQEEQPAPDAVQDAAQDVAQDIAQDVAHDVAPVEGRLQTAPEAPADGAAAAAPEAAQATQPAAEAGSEFGVDEAADDDADDDADADADAVIPSRIGVGTVGENPWDEGAGTSPEGRVHFMHFYTWNTLQGHIVSLRNDQGVFQVPGYVTAIQDTRAAGPILASIREAAIRRGWELSIQKLFVPVVYPVHAVFRQWKQTANPFEQNIVYLHYLLQNNDIQQLNAHISLEEETETRPMRTYYTALLESASAVKDFFADPRHASCHGLVLRDAANLFFGRKFPNGGRLINYAILRPEWIVDVRPVAGSPDLLGRARRDPRTSLARIRKLLVTSDGELTKARAAETRRLKREGLDSTAMETRSVYDDGLDYILNGLAGKRQRS